MARNGRPGNESKPAGLQNLSHAAFPSMRNKDEAFGFTARPVTGGDSDEAAVPRLVSQQALQGEPQITVARCSAVCDFRRAVIFTSRVYLPLRTKNGNIVLLLMCGLRAHHILLTKVHLYTKHCGQIYMQSASHSFQGCPSRHRRQHGWRLT